MKKNKKAILFGSWIAILVILVFVVDHLSTVSNSGPPPPPPPPPAKSLLSKNWKSILAMASPVRGKADAPYTLVEFGDFECPLCGYERPKIEAFVAGAPVNMYFVNRPFSKHPDATPAAEAALSAAAQHKFWPMYDSLYVHQKQLSAGKYESYADAIGIDGKRVASDVRSNAYLNRVKQSADYCDSIGVSVTPTIVVRNNKTGELMVARSDDEITRLVNDPHWTRVARTLQVAKAASANSPTGRQQ